MNKKNVLQFTTVLSELMNSDLNLKSALETMTKMSGINKKCKKASCEIKQYLSEGSKFSMSLKKCQAIEFEEAYIAFIGAAEKNGRLTQTINFLKEREEKKNEMKNKFVSMSVYPSFVIFLSFAGGIVLSIMAPKLLVDLSGSFDFETFNKTVIWTCVQANLFLLIAIFALVKFFKTVFNKKILLDVFKVLDFMNDSGVDFYSGLETSLLVVDKNQSIKNQISQTMMDICSGKKISEVLGNFGKNFQVYAEVAESSGNLGKVFKQICFSIESKFNRVEKMCGDLMGPGILCIAGVYLGIFLNKIMMPILFNYDLGI